MECVPRSVEEWFVGPTSIVRELLCWKKFQRPCKWAKEFLLILSSFHLNESFKDTCSSYYHDGSSFWSAVNCLMRTLSYYHILLRFWFEYSEKLLSSHLMNFGLLTVKLKDTIFTNPVLIKCSKSALPVTSCACQLNIRL